MARLGDICTITMGQSPASSSYNTDGDGMPFFQGNVDFGEIHPTVRVWCNAPKKIAKAGDVLISVRAPIGALNIADTDCCIGRGLAALTTNKDVCIKKYLWYAIASKVHELNAKGTGSTFKAISKNILSDTEIALPAIGKQEKKAAILDHLTHLIALRRQQLAKLDDLIKARFVEMFGDPISNEKGWKTVAIIEACQKIFGGGTPSKSHTKYFMGDIPWVSPKDMKEDVISDSIDHITEEAVANSTTNMVPTGSVLMVIRSGILKHTLPVAINAVPVTINQDMKAFVPGKEIAASYLRSYFKAIEPDVLAGVRGVTADNIDFKMFQQRQMIMPPITLQNEYELFCKQVDKSKVAVQKSLAKTQTLFDSLMQQYFG